MRLWKRFKWEKKRFKLYGMSYKKKSMEIK